MRARRNLSFSSKSYRNKLKILAAVERFSNPTRELLFYFITCGRRPAGLLVTLVVVVIVVVVVVVGGKNFFTWSL